MIKTSMAYKRAVHAPNREFSVHDTYAFVSGEIFEMSIGDFLSYIINDSTSERGKFTVGAAVIKKYTAILNNAEDKFTGLNFQGCVIDAKVGLRLEDGTIEILPKGRYVIVNARDNGLTIEIEAYDGMLYFDKAYSESALVYPTTLREIIKDACTMCGVSHPGPGFGLTFPDFEVNTRPGEDMTFRDIISYAAQISCCFARMSVDDKLEVSWYSHGMTKDRSDLDGGKFKWKELFADFKGPLNTRDGMTCIRNNDRLDDSYDTIEGVDWFKFNNVVCDKIYVAGDSWIGFGVASPQLKIYSQEASVMDSLYRQEGTLNGKKFLKIRWEGSAVGDDILTSRPLSAFEQKYEVFLMETGEIYINVMQTTMIEIRYGKSSLTCGENIVKLEIFDSSGSGRRIILYPMDTEGKSWYKSCENGYTCGSIVDGGTFNYDVDIPPYDAKDFAQLNKLCHHLYELSSQSISTENTTITGVSVLTESGEVYKRGENDYEVTIEKNPLIQTSYDANLAARWLEEMLVDARFRTMTISCRSDPSIEAGDFIIVTDRKMNTYRTIITNNTFVLGGLQTVECDAEIPTEKKYIRRK